MNKTYQLLFQNGEMSEDNEIGEHHNCIMALAIASKYKVSDANAAIKKLSNEDPSHECSYLFEAKSLIFFAQREFNSAKEFAQRAIENDDNSYFAYFVLARIAVFEKKYDEALKYYGKILEYFPEKDKVKLDIAETYILGKNFALAQSFVGKAPKSARKYFCQVRLVFKSSLARIVFGVFVLSLYAFPSLLVGVYVTLTSAFVYILIKHGYQKGDLVVIRLFGYLLLFLNLLSFPGFCALINEYAFFHR